MIKIIHTADIHLGRPFPHLRKRGSDYRAQLIKTFDKIIDLAITEHVSLLLVAGDLFDSNRVHGIVIAKAISAFKKLDQVGIRVCILPGTHDSFDEDSIYRFVSFPENVIVFTPEHIQQVYPDLNLTVYGSLPDSRQAGGRLLQGLLLTESSFHVGMVHGSIQRPGLIDDSWTIHASEIAGSGLDYLALGHWHSFQDVSQGNTKAFYCGSPEPVDMDQKGAGFVSLVTLNEKNGVEAMPIRVGTRKFDTIDLDISPFKSLGNILETLEAGSDVNLILDVTLTGLRSSDYDLDSRELEDILRDKFFHLRVQDKSSPLPGDLNPASLPVETVMGRFVGILAQKIEVSNPEEKLVLEEVLKLGIALLQGRTQVIE